MKKPDARGPSPQRKAQRSVGNKLARPAKPPPTPPGMPAGKNPPPSRRITDHPDPRSRSRT